MKLITTEDDYDVNEKETITKMASQIDLSRVVEVLTRQLSHKQIHTRIAVLRWVLQLHMKTPNRVRKYIIISVMLQKRIICDLIVTEEIKMYWLWVWISD